MLENKIESACGDWATLDGWSVFKFVSPGNRGVPDRLFLKNGVTVFVEFKTPGSHLSPLQTSQIRRIRKQGFRVLVIDGLEDFKRAFPKSAA